MPLPERSRFAGMLAIVRYNWPFYVVAAIVLLTCSVLLTPGLAPWLFWPVLAASMGTFWFLAGSLTISHWVYDLSPLYRWQWIQEIYRNAPPKDAVICVAGFDEASGPLGHVMPGTSITVLDHYDATIMTEPSISRARRALPPGPESIATPFDHWPAIKTDLVLAPLSIHELRSDAERSAWFTAARAALHPNGRIVVVEHVRDFANFLAFGPGFMHFHSVASWKSCWQAAHLELHQHLRITPFIRVFVLR